MTRLLTLAVVFLLILFYTYEVELPREERKANEMTLLGGKTQSDVRSVEVTSPKGSFTLRKKELVREEGGDAWELASVPGSLVESGTMNALLSAFGELKLEQGIPASEREADLGIYGLKEPEMILKVALPDGVKELRLGKLNRFVGKRYVQLGSEGDLFLVADAVFEAGNKRAEEFRSHTPVVFSDGEISTARLVRGDEEIVLQLKDQEWWLEKPLVAKASGMAFPDLARELRNLRAEEFVDDTSAPTLKEYGFEPAAFEAELRFKKSDRAPVRVRVGKRVTTVKNAGTTSATTKGAAGEKKTEHFAFVVDGQPSIYTLKSDPIAALFKSVWDLREKRLFTFAGEAVRSVKFEQNGSSWEMTKQDGIWKVGDAAGDATFISSYLFDLAQLEASSFTVPAQGHGLDTPSMTITVTLQSGDGKEIVRKLLVGKQAKVDGKDVFYAAVQQQSDAFTITSDAHRRIVPKRETFVKVEPTPVPPAAVAENATPTPAAAP